MRRPTLTAVLTAALAALLVVLAPTAAAQYPSIPAKHLKDLVALAKARPGQLNYGSPGVGTSLHLTGELFKQVHPFTAV